MKHLFEYINIRKGKSTIKTTDKTIKQIVKSELDKLGHDANLNHIDVSEVTDMSELFNWRRNTLLGPKYRFMNPDVSNWNVSNVENMYTLFFDCKNFNSDLSRWDVSNVNNMIATFYCCEKFNQDLSRWNVSKVESMGLMFIGCKSFNQDLSRWNVSNVRDMKDMFAWCESFDQDLSKWDVSNVNNIGLFDYDHYDQYMFNGCPIRDKFMPNLRKFEK